MTKHVTIDKKDMPKWFFTEQIEAQRQRAEKAEARVKELEHGTVTCTWTPEQFERLVGKVIALFMKTKGKNPTGYRFVSSVDGDEYKFECTTEEKGDEI